MDESEDRIVGRAEPSAAESPPDLAAPRRTFSLPAGGGMDVTLVRPPDAGDDEWAARTFLLEAWTKQVTDAPVADRPGVVRVDESRPVEDVPWVDASADDRVEGRVVSPHWEDRPDPPAVVSEGLRRATPGDEDFLRLGPEVVREDGATYVRVPDTKLAGVYATAAGEAPGDLGDEFYEAMNAVADAVAPLGEDAPEPTPAGLEAAVARNAPAMFGEGWGSVTVAPSVERDDPGRDR
jgi:hypothetical protein